MAQKLKTGELNQDMWLSLRVAEADFSFGLTKAWWTPEALNPTLELKGLSCGKELELRVELVVELQRDAA